MGRINSTVSYGTIGRKVEDRGFGFITPEGATSGRDGVFFHASDLDGVEYPDLAIGASVSCVVEQTSKGARARNVERV